VGSATALGDNAGAVTVSATGAALDLNGTTMTGTNALTLNGTGISSGGALTNSSATAGTYAGLVTLGSTGVSIGGHRLITLSNTARCKEPRPVLGWCCKGRRQHCERLQWRQRGTPGAGTVTVNAGTWTLSGRIPTRVPRRSARDVEGGQCDGAGNQQRERDQRSGAGFERHDHD